LRNRYWAMSYWTVALVLYACFYVYTLKDRHRTDLWGPQWPVHLLAVICKLSMWACGVTQEVVFEAPFVPGNQCVLACSPHGAFTLSGVYFTAPSHRVRPEFKHHRFLSLGATPLFFIPILREIFMLYGAREGTKENAERIIKAGCSVGVAPGGIWEMANTDHLKEKVYVQKNLGFLKLAIKHKMHVVPMYSFGENQLFTTHTLGLKFRRWLSKKLRFGFPLCTGKLGTPLPHATHVTQVYGPAIDTMAIAAKVRAAAGKKQSEEEVAVAVLDAVYAEYKKGVQGLFDRNAAKCLPAAVVKKGLAITRIGVDPEPMFRGMKPPKSD